MVSRKRILILSVLLCLVGAGYYVFCHQRMGPGPSLAKIQQHGGVLHWLLSPQNILVGITPNTPSHTCRSGKAPLKPYDEMGCPLHVENASLLGRVLIQYDPDGFVLTRRNYESSPPASHDIRQCRSAQNEQGKLVYGCSHDETISYDVETGLLSSDVFGIKRQIWLDESGLIVKRIESHRLKPMDEHSEWERVFLSMTHKTIKADGSIRLDNNVVITSQAVRSRLGYVWHAVLRRLGLEPKYLQPRARRSAYSLDLTGLTPDGRVYAWQAYSLSEDGVRYKLGGEQQYRCQPLAATKPKLKLQ